MVFNWRNIIKKREIVFVLGIDVLSWIIGFVFIGFFREKNGSRK